MKCVGTNNLHNFSFLKKLKHIILFSHFEPLNSKKFIYRYKKRKDGPYC